MKRNFIWNIKSTIKIKYFLLLQLYTHGQDKSKQFYKEISINLIITIPIPTVMEDISFNLKLLIIRN